MNCKYCGNPLSEGSTFCGKCGQRVVEEEFDSVEAQYVEPVYETPDQEKKRKKNATSILVMSIFSLLFLAIAGYVVANGVEVFIEAFQDIEAGIRVDSGDIEGAITFLGLVMPFAILAIVFAFVTGKRLKNHRKTFGGIKGAASGAKVISVITRIGSVVNIILHVALIFLLTFAKYGRLIWEL